MSILTTNTAPRQLAASKQDVAELVDLIANEVIRRIDQRETSRMISNTVRDAVASHLAKQNAAKAEAEPENIYANYEINPAGYLNNMLETK